MRRDVSGGVSSQGSHALQTPIHRVPRVTMSPTTVAVDTGHRRYEILIGSGLLDAAGSWAGLPKAAHAVVVSNTTIAPRYAARPCCHCSCCHRCTLGRRFEADRAGFGTGGG